MKVNYRKGIVWKLCLLALLMYGVELRGQKVECYKNMVYRSSPYQELIGRYPISEKKTGQADHYRIYRDANGKATKIEHWSMGRISMGGYQRFGAIGGAATMKVRYENGKEIRTYLDAKNDPVMNFWKVAEEVIERDKSGFKKRLTYRDLSGKQIADSRGVWETIWSVQENGRTVVEERFGENGEPKRFNNFLDFGRVRMVFDERGLRRETWNIDETGKPILSPQRKVAGMTITWTDLDEKELTWLDEKGEPKNLSRMETFRNFYGYASETYEHDSFGNITALIWRNSEGQIYTIAGLGYAYSRRIFDAEGFIIDQRYFNGEGLPTTNSQGVAREEFIRNAERLPTELRRYGLNGELVNATEDGAAIVQYLYAENGNLIDKRLLDKNGKEVSL